MFDDGFIYLMIWSFTIVLCIILFFICTIIYLKSKQKVFLYYGLYNLVLFSYVALKNTRYPDFILGFIYESNFRIYNYYSQVVYLFFLFLFYLHFLDIHLSHPLKYKRIRQYLSGLLVFFSLLFSIGLYTGNVNFFNSLFFYLFLPSIFILTLYCLYIFFRKNSKPALGIFSVAGIISYNIFAYIALYKSLYPDGWAYPLVYFYIGIALESFVFVVGLSYKIDLIIREKTIAQNKIIAEQKSVGILQQKYQKDLEQKIVERENQLRKSQQIAEKRKIEFIKKDYLAQLESLRLSSLQSQMNPHFIFNALNSIKVYFIENKQTEAIFYLNKFSKLIRKILESSRTEYHSLEEELKIIQLYISIENIRFDNDIELIIDRPEGLSLEYLKVPSLFLQPFVENAIWHGLAFSKKHKTINIWIEKHTQGIKLVLGDNGIGRAAAAAMREKKTFKRESVGLKMTEDRFKLFNQKHHCQFSYYFKDLFDQNGNADGTKVVFKLFSNSN